jgi:hypothetical protein
MAIGALLAMLALSSAPAPTAVTMAPAAAPEGGGSTTSGGTAPSAESSTGLIPGIPGASTTAGSTAGGTKGAAAAPEPSHPVTMQPVTEATAPCGGLFAAVDSFLQHLNAAHLETSPGQQVSDALDVDQYVKTHTVLVENMLKPLLGGSTAALDTFLQHVYAAHLEASPGQQAADVLDVDQYVKTHTVMVENMLKPLAGTDVSSC